MGHTIAKIWSERNATDLDLSEDEKLLLAIRFHKTLRNVEQAIRDTRVRYMRGGRRAHVLRRDLALPELGDMRQPSQAIPEKQSTPGTPQVEETNSLARIRFPPRAEELLRKSQKRK